MLNPIEKFKNGPSKYLSEQVQGSIPANADTQPDDASLENASFNVNQAFSETWTSSKP